MCVILDSIDLKGEKDLNIHFNGIKQILNTRLLNLSKKIYQKKNNINNVGLELEPEKPVSFKQVVDTNQLFEQENKQIIQNQGYEQTKMKLLKIDQIQKAIQEHLIVQDERIDKICKITGETGEIYNKIAEGEDFSSGSFFRRAANILLLCLSFILLFLHFFYKKNQ